MLRAMDQTELKALIERLGGPTKVSEAMSTPDRPLGQSAVSNWTLRGRVPAEHCASLARLAGVDPSVIRPDIFPAPSGPRSEAA